MMRRLKLLLADENGAALAEYALLVALLALAALGVNTMFRNTLKTLYDHICRFRTGFPGGMWP
jgi:Flp pilus assembly pilin Flp